MYKLLFNEQQQVIGFGTVYEQQESDVIFLEQDLPLVREYLKPLHIEEHQELQDIQAWLQAHDYIINKHLLGEYKDNDKRWTDYLQQRQVKLARYNDLEQVIAQAVKEPFDLTLLTPVDDVVDEVVEQVVDDVVDDVIPIEEQINYSYEDIEAAKNMDVVEDLEKVEETDSTDEDTEKALTE
jgi:hypothetical protein